MALPATASAASLLLLPFHGFSMAIAASANRVQNSSLISKVNRRRPWPFPPATADT